MKLRYIVLGLLLVHGLHFGSTGIALWVSGAGPVALPVLGYAGVLLWVVGLRIIKGGRT